MVNLMSKGVTGTQKVGGTGTYKFIKAICSKKNVTPLPPALPSFGSVRSATGTWKEGSTDPTDIVWSVSGIDDFWEFIFLDYNVEWWMVHAKSKSKKYISFFQKWSNLHERTVIGWIKRKTKFHILPIFMFRVMVILIILWRHFVIWSCVLCKIKIQFIFSEVVKFIWKKIYIFL